MTAADPSATHGPVPDRQTLWREQRDELDRLEASLRDQERAAEAGDLPRLLRLLPAAEASIASVVERAKRLQSLPPHPVDAAERAECERRIQVLLERQETTRGDLERRRDAAAKRLDAISTDGPGYDARPSDAAGSGGALDLSS